MAAPFMTTYIVSVTLEKEQAMKINYRLRQLSRSEQEYIEMILLEEIELQGWFAVTYNPMMNEETFLTLQ